MIVDSSKKKQYFLQNKKNKCSAPLFLERNGELKLLNKNMKQQVSGNIIRLNIQWGCAKSFKLRGDSSRLFSSRVEFELNRTFAYTQVSKT